MTENKEKLKTECVRSLLGDISDFKDKLIFASGKRLDKVKVPGGDGRMKIIGGVEKKKEMRSLRADLLGKIATYNAIKEADDILNIERRKN